jgi:predicted ATP-binding protein involved in virulence
MYIKKVTITKFRILEDLEVELQEPLGDGTNIVNVIAGVNGCGKTSLLQGIIDGFLIGVQQDAIKLYIENFPAINKKEFKDAIISSQAIKRGWSDCIPILNKFLQDKPQDSAARLFFFAAHLDSEYQQVSSIKREYQFFNAPDTRTMLGNAEFYIREYVLSRERNSHLSDPSKRAQEAVDVFNSNFEDTGLLTRLVELDPKQFNRPVFQNIRGDRITIDKLSDGEKQLYGRVVALMIFEPKDSIILIDEPEISLHPRWQRVIMRIYGRIGRNNQFIIATHSPQIISETPYKNLIIMQRDSSTDRIQVVYPQHPPSGIDINTILQEVMGANFISPEQLELHRQYRQIVEEGIEQSNKGLMLYNKILEREADTSQFLQEMKLLIEFRDEE